MTRPLAGEVEVVPGPRDFALLHERAIPQKDQLCGPFWGALILSAAGMDGMERGLDPGEPSTVDPATLSEEERAERGIYPLPGSLDESLDALEKDDVLIEALGEQLVRTHVAVARAQAEISREIPPEEVAATAAMNY